ncbi:MAG: hypothetical protein PHD37_10810 [Gallionellaceae bacterium]|nr:hypothetical protein [Gallionellaceae bacterium]
MEQEQVMVNMEQERIIADTRIHGYFIERLFKLTLIILAGVGFSLSIMYYAFNSDYHISIDRTKLNDADKMAQMQNKYISQGWLLFDNECKAELAMNKELGYDADKVINNVRTHCYTLKENNKYSQGQIDGFNKIVSEVYK